MNEPLRIIETGGTIDEDHADSTGKSIFTETHVPEMLLKADIAAGVVTDLLMMKDSSDVTDEDRQLILERCKSSPETKVIVTHGTNTMVETAEVLGKSISDKVVILVGAFIPYVREGSDALSNLKFAIENVRRLPLGVYVAMNGSVFLWNNV